MNSRWFNIKRALKNKKINFGHFKRTCFWWFAQNGSLFLLAFAIFLYFSKC